jgi:hypothetical protein
MVTYRTCQARTTHDPRPFAIPDWPHRCVVMAGEHHLMHVCTCGLTWLNLSPIPAMTLSAGT